MDSPMRIITTFSLLLLTSCSGDGVKDDSINAALSREAMCTVAAERFHLYNEAQKHYEHGVEIVRQTAPKHIDKDISGEFKKTLVYSREYMSNMSKDYNSLFLSKNCNFKIKKFEFDQAG